MVYNRFSWKKKISSLYWLCGLVVVNFIFAIFAAVYLQSVAVELITLFIIFSALIFITLKFEFMSFFRRQLKKDLIFSFWMYIPLMVIIIFAVFAVHYFPSNGMQLTGLFIIFMFAFVFWVNCKK